MDGGDKVLTSETDNEALAGVSHQRVPEEQRCPKAGRFNVNILVGCIHCCETWNGKLRHKSGGPLNAVSQDTASFDPAAHKAEDRHDKASQDRVIDNKLAGTDESLAKAQDVVL